MAPAAAFTPSGGPAALRPPICVPPAVQAPPLCRRARGRAPLPARTAPRAAARSISPEPSILEPLLPAAARAAAQVRRANAAAIQRARDALFLSGITAIKRIPHIRTGLGFCRILSVATKVAHQSLFPEVITVEQAFVSLGHPDLATQLDVFLAALFGASDEGYASAAAAAWEHQYHVDPWEQNSHEAVDNMQGPENAGRSKHPAAAAERERHRLAATALVEKELAREVEERFGESARIKLLSAALARGGENLTLDLVLARWELDLNVNLPIGMRVRVHGVTEYAIESDGDNLEAGVVARRERWDAPALQAAAMFMYPQKHP